MQGPLLRVCKASGPDRESRGWGATVLCRISQSFMQVLCNFMHKCCAEQVVGSCLLAEASHGAPGDTPACPGPPMGSLVRGQAGGLMGSGGPLTMMGHALFPCLPSPSWTATSLRERRSSGWLGGQLCTQLVRWQPGGGGCETSTARKAELPEQQAPVGCTMRLLVLGGQFPWAGTGCTTPQLPVKHQCQANSSSSSSNRVIMGRAGALTYALQPLHPLCCLMAPQFLGEAGSVQCPLRLPPHSRIHTPLEHPQTS